MSFQKLTYERARQAIEQGDVKALKRLIHRPVEDKSGQRLTWLTNLVRQAAKAGLGDAVIHLAALNPLGHRKLLANAWALGVQFGHVAMARTLEADPHFPNHLRFSQACASHAWDAVVHLLDEGPTPTPAQAELLFEKLATAHPSNAPPAALPRFLALADQVPGPVASGVLKMAMRTQDDDLLIRTLARMDGMAVQASLSDLVEEAAFHDRYDWAQRLHDGSALGLSEQTWGEKQILRALDLEHLRFVEEALNDRPQARAYFLAKGYATARRGRELVEARNRYQDEDGLACRQRLLLRLFPDERLDLVKNSIRDEMRGPRRDACLTRLVEWVPADVRERWLREEPVTFGQAIAILREDQAAAEPLAPRRARIRA